MSLIRFSSDFFCQKSICNRLTHVLDFAQITFPAIPQPLLQYCPKMASFSLIATYANLPHTLPFLYDFCKTKAHCVCAYCMYRTIIQFSVFGQALIFPSLIRKPWHGFTAFSRRALSNVLSNLLHK